MEHLRAVVYDVYRFLSAPRRNRFSGLAAMLAHICLMIWAMPGMRPRGCINMETNVYICITNTTLYIIPKLMYDVVFVIHIYTCIDICYMQTLRTNMGN